MLILASASPRRREMLERVGIAIEVVAAEIDESPHEREDPEAYVRRIAVAKAAAIAARFPGRWVLAADTTVTIDGLILGKPGDPAEATAMLRQLSGRTHQVITGFAIRGPGTHLHAVTTGGQIDGEETWRYHVRLHLRPVHSCAPVRVIRHLECERARAGALDDHGDALTADVLLKGPPTVGASRARRERG